MNTTNSAGASGEELSQRLIESGHQLEDAGDVAAALLKYQESIAAAPSVIRGHLNLGNALQRLGRTQEAIAALQSALRIDPESAPCHFNLGNVHVGAGDNEAAEREFRAALRLDPQMTHAAIALANVLEMLQRSEEAEQELERVLAERPDCAPAAYNLGLLLQKRDKSDRAETLFRACLDADPSFLSAYTALGDLTRNAGRAREAEPWYRKALAVDPSLQEAWSALLFSFNNRDDMTPEEVLAEHLRFGEVFPEHAPARQTDAARDRTHGRVRVGYLSGDFIQHPVALFLRPVLMHHDRVQFEVFAYSNNAMEDGMTEEIRSRVDHYRNIARLDDVAAAQLIHADDLDILIDLSGHSARSRILLFNFRCAPVQATWLGYLNTTGLRSADFRICDRFTDPVGIAERLHTERLLRLPDSQWCYSPVLDIPRVPMPRRGAPERMVFGSFNHISKLSDRCIALWCRVLRAVPGSEIRLFAATSGEAMSALRQKFEQQGIGRGRISVHPRMKIDDYFAAIGDVDVALDSIPYNGGTTTCDVLWMEVPLVALAGDRPAARSGVSILNTLELPELIATTDDEYVAINVRLAANGEWRRRLRETLRARMLASPLMDAAGFARGFEDGVRGMLGKS